MDTATAAFADLTVNYENRRAEEMPGVARPTLAAVNNHLRRHANQNPNLSAWHNFRPGDDPDADAQGPISRGQAYRYSLPGCVVQPAPPPPKPAPPKPLAQPLPAKQPKLKVAAEDQPRPRRTAEQPAVVAKPAPASK
jgi:hypothetical protein